MKKHKTGIIFTLIILVSGAVGALAGIGAIRGEEVLLRLGQSADIFLRKNAVWGMALVLLVQVTWGAKLLLAARRSVARAQAQPEEDDLCDRADHLCDDGISLMGICNVIAFTLMGFATAGLYHGNRWIASVIIAVMLVLCSMTVNVWFTNRFVKLTGVLYPEKTASVLSMNFQKEWFASCDEAERHRIGQASYQAMRAGLTACVMVMLLAMLLAMLLNTGILPIVAVSAIWLSIVGSYLAACRKGRTKG